MLTNVLEGDNPALIYHLLFVLVTFAGVQATARPARSQADLPLRVDAAAFASHHSRRAS